MNKTPLRPADPARLMNVGPDFTPSYLGNLGSRSVGGPRGPVSTFLCVCWGFFLFFLTVKALSIFISLFFFLCLLTFKTPFFSHQGHDALSRVREKSQGKSLAACP